MDWIEFGSKAIEHLVWPAVVVYLLRTQKKGIEHLIERIKKVKIGSAEAEISEKAKDVKEQAAELVATPVEPPKQAAIKAAEVPLHVKFVAGHSSMHANLSVFAPSERDARLRASGLIIEQWARLESTIRYLLSKVQPLDTLKMPFIEVLRHLQELLVLSPEVAALIRDLRKLRNQVAHSQIEPTTSAAEDFAQTCASVNERIAEEHHAWEQAVGEVGNDQFDASAGKDDDQPQR